MRLSSIFDVFSRRDASTAPFQYVVPATLRRKILLLCREVFSNSRKTWGGDGQDYTATFWSEINQALLYRHGRFRLSENSSVLSPAEDSIGFLISCDDSEFLDFVEYVFRVDCLFRVSVSAEELVTELNQLFASENVGYELTNMIREEITEPVHEYPFFGREGTVIKTISYPQIVRKDNQVTHRLAVAPTLQLLSHPKFKTANQEFLEALEDFNQGDYGDCLTKCCSAFESVMKIICEDRGWPHEPNDTASKLITVVIENTGLDSYFTQPLTIIATLRNKLSKAHGAGVKPRAVPQNIARYALNSTASAILLLVETAGYEI